MAYRFLPEEFGFDSVIILFFERISYIMDPPSPTSDNGDHRNLGLIMPCDLRHPDLVPCFRPGTPATFTAKCGIYWCGGALRPLR